MSNKQTTPDPHSFTLYAPDGQTYSPWLKHYDNNVPAEVVIPDEPLYYWLDKAVENNPDEVAVVFKNYKLTYRQLKEQAETLAANLRAQGMRKGDMVSLMLPNLPQSFVAFWGVLKAGGVVIMTNPLYMELELQHQLNDANVKYMITVDLCWPKLHELRQRLGVKKYFVTSVADGLGFPLNWLLKFKDRKKDKVPFDGKTVFPYKALLSGNERLSESIEDPAETMAVLQYSGGTTGVPKGAMLTHRNLSANVVQAIAVLFAGQKMTHQKFLAVLPFFHVYGLTTCLLLPIALGSTVYPTPRFAPLEALSMLQKHRISIFPGAPAVYIAMMQQKDAGKFDLRSVKYLVSGSAAMPREYIRIFEEKTGGGIIEGYGLTEASPITHLNPLHKERKVGTIGMPLPGTEARIVDMELGNLMVPPGSAGELVIKGPQVMKGYWKRPDETANVLRNGWLYTGDIAIMDEEGYFSIVDRKKDMVIVGGYNVYPREIDEVLYMHPKVKDAVAVGVSHPSRGEIIKAFIVPKPGETLSKTEIISFCRERLANYKVPKQVEFREELPKSLVGKILRRALRTEEDEKRKRKEARKQEEAKAAKTQDGQQGGQPGGPTNDPASVPANASTNASTDRPGSGPSPEGLAGGPADGAGSGPGESDGR